MNAAFRIEIEGGKIVLSGVLDGSPDTRRTLFDKLRIAGKSRNEWTIEASGIGLDVAGETQWVKAVLEHLGNCRLTYLPSQLATVLEYDDAYQHRLTKLPDSDSDCSQIPSKPVYA